MARKENSLLWLGIAAAGIAAVYFMTNKKPFTANVPGFAPVSTGQPNYLAETSGAVSDIISNLANRQPPLQLTPPDMQTLKPLNLDLNVQAPNQIEETQSENYDV